MTSSREVEELSKLILNCVKDKLSDQCTEIQITTQVVESGSTQAVGFEKLSKKSQRRLHKITYDHMITAYYKTADKIEKYYMKRSIINFVEMHRLHKQLARLYQLDDFKPSIKDIEMDKLAKQITQDKINFRTKV